MKVRLLIFLLFFMLLASMPFVQAENGKITNFFKRIYLFFKEGVTGFIAFNATASANLTIWDDTDSLARYPGDNVFFYANYSNATTGISINDSQGNCSLNVSDAPSTFNAMAFNSTSGFWEYNKSFSGEGIFYFSVNCTSLSYDAAVATDDISISTPQLIIENVTNRSITNQSAIINWSTNVAGNSIVKYGTNVSNLSNSITNSSLVLQHSMPLTGLSNNTLYFYNVSSYNSSTNFNESGPFNFTTLQNNDTTPPSLIVLSPQNNIAFNKTNISLLYTVSDNVAVDKCWFRNPAGSIINLPNCTNTTFIANEGSNNITVYANDTRNNTNSTQIFFTVDLTAPTISNISSTTTLSRARVTWITNELSNSSVKYGTSSGTLDSFAGSTAFELNHSVDILELSAGTTYYYSVTSCDIVGNCRTNITFNFTTQSAPAPETHVRAVEPIYIQEIVPAELTEEPYETSLTPGGRFVFNINGVQHEIKVTNVFKEESVTVLIKSNTIEIVIKKGETKEIDIDGDGMNDILITIKDIVVTKVTLLISKLKVAPIEKVEEKPKIEVIPLPEVPAPPPEKPVEKEFFLTKYQNIILAIVVIVFIGSVSAGIFISRRPTLVEVEVKPETREEVKPEAEEVKKELEEKKAKKIYDYHELMLETIMLHIYDMIKKKYSEEKIKAALEELNLAPIVIQSIMVEMRKKDNKIDRLISYVKRQLEAGFTKDELKEILMKRGWQEEIVKLVLNL